MRRFLKTVFIVLVCSITLPSVIFADESVPALPLNEATHPEASASEDQEGLPTAESAAAGNPDVWIAEGGKARFVTPDGEVTYEYQDINGLAVAEGDIILGRIEEFKNQENSDGIQSRGLMTTRQMGRDWPNGIIPYQIAPDFVDRALVTRAIEEYHKKTSLRFVPRTTQNDYIHYINQATFLSSMSPIGRQGGAQEVKINFFRLSDGARRSDDEMVTTIVHETAHSLGMKHEQSRSDRDSFLRFDYDCEWDNRFWYEISGNFATAPEYQRMGTYDFDSIMQYPSIPGTKKDTGEACLYFVRQDTGAAISGGSALSDGDVQAFAQRYGVFRTSSQTTPAGGGGGKSFTLDCPSDRVLVGITGRAHAWVDGLRSICAKVNYNGSWSGATTQTAYKGGGGGSAFTRTCPQGQAVSGLSGRAGMLVDRLRVHCRSLVNATQEGSARAGRLTGNTTGLSSAGGSGGQAFGRYDCLEDMPGRGLSGRSGVYLDRIQLRCRPGSTLPSQPILLSPPQHANLGGTRRPQLRYMGGYKATERTVVICPANANAGYCATGASNTIRFSGGETGTVVPQDLGPGQYKWHITAKNSLGAVNSPIRQFSILPGPRVVLTRAEAGKLCRGTSSNNTLTAIVLNDGLGGTSQTVKASLFWATYNPEAGYVPSGQPLQTVDIGGLAKNQSKTATFTNIRLPATPRSVDVLVITVPYPDGLTQDKQAAINVGQYLGSYTDCLSKSTATKLSSYPTYYRVLRKK